MADVYISLTVLALISSNFNRLTVPSSATIHHTNCSNYAETLVGGFSNNDYSLETIYNIVWSEMSSVGLLWTRPHGTLLFRPHARRSVSTCMFALLLLLCGDVHSNAGLVGHHVLRIGSLNPNSTVNKTDLILNCIDEQRRDILAVMESYIKSDHLTTIKNDPAPPGYSIQHVYRQSNMKTKGGGIDVIARESLRVRQFNITGKFESFEISAVRLIIRTGRFYFFTIYRPSRSPGFHEEFRHFSCKVIILPGSLYICGDMNCPSKIKDQVNEKMQQISNHYNLVQHIQESTHNRDGLLHLVITSSLNPEVTSMHVEDPGISDHSLVVATLGTARPRSRCETFAMQNMKSIDINKFRSLLTASEVCTEVRHQRIHRPTLKLFDHYLRPAGQSDV